MANRRMFSLDIVDSDAFLDMPQSSQNLYFHLAMRADDDGFVSNPKKILRMIGGQDDDYKLLVAKRFLITFEKGVCVIKHWKIHNYIRKDTYKETRYLDEKSTLKTKDNGSYTESGQIRGRLVDGSATQVRLGKVSIDKNTTGQNKFDLFWSLYPKKVKKAEAKKKFLKLKEDVMDEILKHLEERVEKDKQWKRGYVPHPTTFLNGELWNDDYEVEEINSGIVYLD